MYPTVVGPRYVGAEVPPNSSFTTAQYTRQGVLPDTELFIEGTIAAPMPVLMPESSTHRIQVETPGGGAHVRLDLGGCTISKKKFSSGPCESESPVTTRSPASR